MITSLLKWATRVAFVKKAYDWYKSYKASKRDPNLRA